MAAVERALRIERRWRATVLAAPGPGVALTPQSPFMVVAPVADGREAELRALLASMNALPGMADPDNALVPFGRFERLHVARFLVLEAPTADDIVVYDIPPSPWPTSLVFLGDCDGPAQAFLAELVERAGPGLRRIFAFCRDFSAMTTCSTGCGGTSAHPSANYVNWIGRTVLQVQEEQALRAALVDPSAERRCRFGRRAAERRAPASGELRRQRAPGRPAAPPAAGADALGLEDPQCASMPSGCRWRCWRWRRS